MMTPNPEATYRIQLKPGFGFDQAAEIIPYLSELGISHLYTSPYLQAAEGSTHGYDIVNPKRVNKELGGESAHERLCKKLQKAGIGHMIDVVANHLAISARQNPWWWDVLENGPSSIFADYFDVDWDSSEDRWHNKILLPVLGDHYGRVLEDGRLQLIHHTGIFVIRYYNNIFPADPSSLAGLLNKAAESCGSDFLAFIAESHARLPRPTVTARQAVELRHRDKEVLFNLRKRLCRERKEINNAIDNEVKRINNDFNTFDEFIEHQNYRLAFWRTASRDLGYRRFFDINDLAGMRVEEQQVFNATHSLLITWVEKNWVQGMRIDHPDGLRDPAEYFRRVQDCCPGMWVVAEKILAPGEKLPPSWQAAGTTGYEFLNLLQGLFIDPKGMNKLSLVYKDITGIDKDFMETAYECKRLILSEILGSEINRLTSLFVHICEKHRRHRDYTSQELREAILETAVYFPVYRSYVSVTDSTVSTEDEHYISDAIENAKRRRKDLDPELFRFFKDLLMLKITVTGRLEGELAMRFQQLTAPAMAKGVEDTAFYRYNRLTALNEVGGDPGSNGTTLTQFHEDCIFRQKRHPTALLASTTHDTKRSEDVRARLVLLSEIPEVWAEAVGRWIGINESYRRNGIPDRNTEYLFYQTLLGAWPINQERISAYMEKAVREAKVYTSWTKPNTEYEDAVKNFIRAVQKDEKFRNDFDSFANNLVTPGRINSMAQTLIKLTAPGVPDIYQGTELWDLSLVDPDNRRPVDFIARWLLIEKMSHISPEIVMSGMDDGMPKMWIIRQALYLRRKDPKSFGPEGRYRPLRGHGKKALHLVAFIRGERVITLAPRLVMQLNNDWEETELELPPGLWKNILTGEENYGGVVSLKLLLNRFPVALLVKKV